MIRRLLSYFVPITIHRQKSGISKMLEVSWSNGQLVLDSKNTNYSYGSLQRILRIGLKNIGYSRIRQMSEILVLGVAGGSVIKTLVSEVGFTGKITGVEIDPEIIKVAKSHFDLDASSNLEIIIDDAFEFVLKTGKCYDLIIVDVFQDAGMPNFLFEKFFAMRLTELLFPNGLILFNTMLLQEAHNQRNQDYVNYFDAEKFRVRCLPRLENHNELILVEKLSEV